MALEPSYHVTVRFRAPQAPKGARLLESAKAVYVFSDQAAAVNFAKLTDTWTDAVSAVSVIEHTLVHHA